MKKILATLLLAIGLAATAATPTVSCHSLGNTTDSIGKPCYTLRFTVDSPVPFSRLAFNTFKRPMSVTDSRDTLIELLPGYDVVASPRYAVPGVTETDINVRGVLRNASYMPDGVHLVGLDGQPIAVEYTRGAITDFPAQWQHPGGADGMVYGPEAYAINDSLRSSAAPGPWMDIPTPYSIALDSTKIVNPREVEVKYLYYMDQESTEFTITPDKITIALCAANPSVAQDKALRRLENARRAGALHPGTVVYRPDFAYRGVMIDVARNFLTADEMRSLIDLIARYDFNVLHLHLGDDEGWRVEIPGLPELTEVGGHRGYTVSDDVPFLKQMYSGDGNPATTGNTANGFYTAAEFVDLLDYAYDRGVAVLPEFDSPGHSRAAIRAMEWRASHNGDARMRLREDGDTSQYTGAQALHDNVMNPALNGPYIFWNALMDGVDSLYRRARVPLPGIHIGGDEVPKGAWNGSAAVKELMAQNGWESQNQVHAYFVRLLAYMAREKNIPLYGWQEMALGHSDDYNAAVAYNTAGINCWTNAGNQATRIAQSGFPVILSNVDYLYMDQTPTTHPEEPGLVWGGLVDEFRPLHATVDNLCPGLPDSIAGRVAGVSAHLFSETVRSLPMVERYLLPRILGAAERGHHAHATLSDNEYFALISAEMPRWETEGLNFYLRQPGIRVNEQKMVQMNTAYPGGLGEIRYTTDGSDPTASSQKYTAPFPLREGMKVRARMFMGNARSVVSIL